MNTKNASDQNTREIVKLLMNIHKNLVIHTKQECHGMNLTIPQFQLMWAVSRHGILNMGRLSHRMPVSKSTLTSTVDNLVRNGLVVRSRDRDDRRVVLLSLTDKGRERLHRFEGTWTGLLKTGVSALNRNDQQKLVVLLGIIQNRMKKHLSREKRSNQA